MPNYRYCAITQSGEIVTGSIAAPTPAEVSHRVEYLGLVLIETALEGGTASLSSLPGAIFSRPRPEDVTVFTRDLGLLLKAGARLHDALELLANDTDVGRLRPTVVKIRSAILSGESFAEAIGRHPSLFSAMYVALVRVGEVSGTLDQILEMLGNERVRAEALRRKFTDALHYPAFVLLAAGAVLLFFILFVLPQFSSVLRDFNAKPDSVIETFLAFSDLLRAHGPEIVVLVAMAVVSCWLVWRRRETRAAVITQVSRLPFVSTVFGFHRTALFCRNLSTLLGSGVPLTTTLRILIDIMSVTGKVAVWSAMADRVRHGGKVSDALAASAIMPAMAVRMLRLGEETGQLPALAGRVADFYEAKLQRHLDRIVGIIGPLAIVTISVVVGGLIVSVMTALLSVNQIVG